MLQFLQIVFPRSDDIVTKHNDEEAKDISNLIDSYKNTDQK